MFNYGHYGIGQARIFLSCGFFFLSFFLPSFSSPILSRHRLDVYHTSTHGVALVRLAENTGHKKLPKFRHLRTIAQLCRAIS